MAPIVTIIIFAVIGFFLKGFIGLIAGAAIGWIISILIGCISLKWNRGFIPKKGRQESAQIFYKNNKLKIDLLTEGMQEKERLKLIEDLLERVFRRATISAPLLSKSMGLSKSEINETAIQEAAKEKNKSICELILLLKDHIIETMY